jgi:UDP-N-acetylglucosamine 2-epimerase (non-hydrolysing)
MANPQEAGTMSDATVPQKVVLIAGTRPNFVKAAPLLHALRERPARFSPEIWIVSQHHAPELVDDILDDLDIQGPQVHRLLIQEGKMGQRLGAMVDGVADALSTSRPDLVVVFGDVDTTLAGAIAAKRAQLPLAHVEAGLRSHDRTMPEELNRLMVDAISDLYLATSQDAVDTLVRDEGKPSTNVHFVGNLMIDSLLRGVDRPHGATLCERHGVRPGNFALATFHRPSNVDAAQDLSEILDMLARVAATLPVLMPVHPRTAASLERHGLWRRLNETSGLIVLPSLRYRDFISLLAHARVAMTDSGGLQEETSTLGVPCLTVRGNTERPVTIDLGSNQLVQPAEVPDAILELMANPMPMPARIPGWDGMAAARAADVIHSWLQERSVR